MLASLIALLFAVDLVIHRPPAGRYLMVDDLNVVFILLNTFVGFTTSAFSASYIRHELETGRLTASYLRFYHAMFQLMLFGMLLMDMSDAAQLHAIAARRAGASWEELQAVISLCFLFRGLPAANRGAEILANIAKREAESDAKG